MSVGPTMPEVLAKVFGAQFAGIHTCMPGRVESYDSDRLSVSVSPAIGRGYKGEDDARAVEYLPVIQNVPLMFPGSGGVRIKFPVTKGDTVLLVFSEASIDRWKARGGGRVDPGDDRRFHLTDAIAIPGLLDFGHAGDATPTIEFTTGGQIHAGGDKPLVTREEFLSHTHLTAGTGPATPPTTIVGPPGSALDFPGTTILKGA